MWLRRDQMNLSEWHQYHLNRQEKLLADIASAVKNGEMPLPQYTLIHRDAKLSGAETDLVYGWARIERRKLKAGPTVVHRGDSGPAESQMMQSNFSPTLRKICRDANISLTASVLLDERHV
jgi:hypothetical protein